MNSIFIILISIHISLIQSDTLSFQENLFKTILEDEKEKNILISPFSIYQILSLTSNGAAEETLKEMLKVLIPYKEIDNEIQNTLNLNLIDIIDKITPKKENNNENNQLNNQKFLSKECNCDCEVTLENANGIFIKKFIKKGFPILNEFLLMCNNYKVEFSELESVQQVNNWVNNKTHEKITEVLSEKYDLSKVPLILVNAIYFKGSWLYEFQQNTQKKEFKNFDNTIIKVDTMYNFFKSIPYYEDEKIQMILLPYKSSKANYNMVIILPRENKYSSSYDYLNNENVNFTKLISNLKKAAEVELYLPKFEFEYENSLKEVLKKMGMIKSFSEKEANFSKINNEKLYIGKILHKTFIKIDQNGTEAAATTVIILENSITSFQEKERYSMYVNHSFIFLITSDNIKDSDYNNLILFLGTVNNLSSSKSENDLGNDKGNSNNNNNNDAENHNNINQNEKKDKTENEDEKNLNDTTVNIFENGGNTVYNIKVYNLLVLILML